MLHERKNRRPSLQGQTQKITLAVCSLQQLTLVTQKIVYATGGHKGTHRTKEGEFTVGRKGTASSTQHHLSLWISVIEARKSHAKTKGLIHSPSVYIHLSCGSVSYHPGSKGHQSRLFIFLIFQRGSSGLLGWSNHPKSSPGG